MWLSKGRRFQAETTASANSQAGSWLARSRACEETGGCSAVCNRKQRGWVSEGTGAGLEGPCRPQLACTPSGLGCHARSLWFPEVGLAQSHTMTELDLGFLPPM